MNTKTEKEQYATDMLDHYIECALWSSIVYTDEDDAEGEHADNYEASHTMRRDALTDCIEFVNMAYNELMKSNVSPETAGHDLWLTRCGHGAGFWDRGYTNGDKLTELAHSMGNVDLYLGDDELVYSQ